MELRIQADAFDANAELARFTSAANAGAVACFIGLCRGETSQGGAVRWLELEHYPGFTEKQTMRLAREAAARFGLADLLVIHRHGRILPGHAIVLVAAASAHRAEAFAAVEQIMDYLKTDAIFWKREMREDGVYWIEPTAQDRARRAAHEGKP